MGKNNKKEACKNCKANSIVCTYCIYKEKNGEEKRNKNIIFYNSKDDRTSKKICSICKKVYIDYPAISRIDNKTLICPKCGENQACEPFEEILCDYGFNIE